MEKYNFVHLTTSLTYWCLDDFQLNNWAPAMTSWDTFCSADPTTLMTAAPGSGLNVTEFLGSLCSVNFTLLMTELNAYQGMDKLNAVVGQVLYCADRVI